VEATEEDSPPKSTCAVAAAGAATADGAVVGAVVSGAPGSDPDGDGSDSEKSRNQAINPWLSFFCISFLFFSSLLFDSTREISCCNRIFYYICVLSCGRLLSTLVLS
jgi:hypothetical protein